MALIQYFAYMAGNSRSFFRGGWETASTVLPTPGYPAIVNTAPVPGRSAGVPPHAANPRGGRPVFAAGSPPRRAPTRALAVRRSAAARLPRQGEARALVPTSPVNSNSPRGRTPAPSAASASPGAAHHFQRGSVERPGRAPGEPSARRPAPPPPPNTPAARTGLSSTSRCEGRILRVRPKGEGEAVADRPSAIGAP